MCNYNIEFYIKYVAIFKFWTTKIFKVSQQLGAQPPDPCSGNLILFLEIPFKKILAMFLHDRACQSMLSALLCIYRKMF